MKPTRVCFECAQGNASAEPAPSSGFGNSEPCPMCKVPTPDLHGFWYNIKVPVVDANQAESAVAPGECGKQIVGAPADAYTLIQQAFHRYWYSHMVQDVIVGAHAQTSYASAWAIWNAAIGMQPPNLICKSCGVDRSKEDCKGDRLRCGLASVAHSGHVAVIGAKPDSVHLAVQLDSPESRLMGDPSEDESLIACLCDDAAKLNQANPDDEMAATMLVAAARIEELQELRTGISSLDRRPNEQKSYVGNFGDTGEAQLRRELANVPLPNYMEGK